MQINRRLFAAPPCRTGKVLVQRSGCRRSAPARSCQHFFCSRLLQGASAFIVPRAKFKLLSAPGSEALNPPDLDFTPP